jgi:hypothetical protein
MRLAKGEKRERGREGEKGRGEFVQLTKYS